MQAKLNDQLIHYMCEEAVKRFQTINKYKIPVGVSNRHIHLTQESVDKLFGKGYELKVKSMLKQPGQYACEETVLVRGPRGEFPRVRILGPTRSINQLEISITDSFKMGVGRVIRESGDIAATPGFEVVGPEGSITLPEGCIVALRHIHMTPEIADEMGVKNGEMVDVKFFGERKAILGNVLIRVSPNFSLEMHLDVDEANAVSVKNGDFAILKKLL